MTGRHGGLAFFVAWALSLLCGYAAALPDVEISAPRELRRAEPQPIGSWGAALASDGEAALVVYLTGIGPHLVGRALSEDGTPLGSPFDVGAEGLSIQSKVQLVFDADSYVVSWVDEDKGGLFYRRIRVADGDFALGPIRQLDSAVPSNAHVASAAGDTGVLFYSCAYERCRVRLLTGDTSVQTFEASLPDGEATGVSLAYSGGVWAAATAHGTTVELERLGADGVPSALAYTLTVGALDEPAPVVIGVADGFVLGWTLDDELRLAHLRFDQFTAPVPESTLTTMQSVTAFHDLDGTLALFGTATEVGCDDCDPVHVLQLVDDELLPTGAAVELGATGYLQTIATTPGGAPHLFARRGPGRVVGTSMAVEPPLQLSQPRAWSESAVDQRSARGAPVADGWAIAWSETLANESGYGVRAAFLSRDGDAQGPDLLVSDEPNRELYDLSCGKSSCLVATSDPAVFATPAAGTLKWLSSDAVSELSDGWWQDSVSVAASDAGWLVLTTDRSRQSLLARRLDPSGALLDETTLTVLGMPVGERVLPLHAARDGSHYVAAWFEEGGVYTRRVPLEGPVPDEMPELLFEQASALSLKVAFRGPEWWAATLTGEHATTFGAGRVPLPLDGRFRSLVLTGDVALLALDDQNMLRPTLALAAQRETPTALASFDEESAPNLSLPSGSRVLLSTERLERNWGVPIMRIVTRVVTVDGVSGGEGGGAGQANEAGQNAGGSSGGALETPEEQPSRSPRRSKGCGCRTAGDESHDSGWALTLLAALTLGRARKRR